MTLASFHAHNRDSYDIAHSSIRCTDDHDGAQIFHRRDIKGKPLRVLAYTEDDAKEAAANFVPEEI